MVGIEGVNRVISKIKRWVTSAISTHTAIAAAHHTKYTDAEALAACEFHDGGESTGSNRTLGNNDNYDLNFETNDLTRICVRKTGMVGINCVPNRTFEVFDAADASIKAKFINANGTCGLGLFYGGNYYGGFDTCGPSFAVPAWRDAVIFTAASNNTGKLIFRTKAGGSYYERMEIENGGTVNFKDNIIKNPKNCVASALSGTKKLVEIDINGTSYYFEVYPTKA